MRAPPRVVFLTDILTPYMVAVLEALAERLDLVALICASRGSRGADWAFPRPFRFRYRVLEGPAITRRSHDGADLYPDPRIVVALRRERPAAVISGAFSFPSAFAALYRRLFGASLIIHSDGTAYSERNLTRTQRAARSLLLRGGTVCVGNSEPAKERFMQLGVPPDRVFLAPHSTDIAPFHAIAARRRLDGDHAPVTVLHVGRLIPRKGIDRLLRAVALARGEVALRLVLVGSGPEESALRQLAGELGVEREVEFRGFVDQPGLPEVYAEADVFAFPTLDDPFGIALLEAVATGLPVVASPFAGATLDLVEDAATGFVVDPNDTAAWASALARLAQDHQLREQLGARGHAMTLARTPSRAADGYVKAVRHALGQSVSTRQGENGD
jgi:glycosyltransferase involved in cell wall biosynthesis